jgi:hypothetical protein
VAVRAAGSISGERDRQTLDSLLASPLDSTAILYGKWLGCVLSVRWGWAWWGSIVGLGMVTSGVSPRALPVLMAAWFIYAGFLAIVGLVFSMVCRSTLRATMWTLLTTLGVATGHWLTSACLMPLPLFGGGSPAFKWMSQFHTFGLTPPVTMGLLAFSDYEFSWIGRNYFGERLACAVIGLGLYVGATALVWRLAIDRFRVMTRRLRLSRSDHAGLGRPHLTLPARGGGPFPWTGQADGVEVQPAADPEASTLPGTMLIEEEWHGQGPQPRPT